MPSVTGSESSWPSSKPRDGSCPRAEAPHLKAALSACASRGMSTGVDAPARLCTSVSRPASTALFLASHTTSSPEMAVTSTYSDDSSAPLTCQRAHSCFELRKNPRAASWGLTLTLRPHSSAAPRGCPHAWRARQHVLVLALQQLSMSAARLVTGVVVSYLQQSIGLGLR